MKRFSKGRQDRWGQVVIFDVENTEPVCTIYAKYHPYVPDLILETLNKNYPEIRPEIKRILKIDE